MIKKLKLVEKITIALLIISILLSIIYLVFNLFVNDNKKIDAKVDFITDKFNYVLYEKDIELYKTEFNNLDKILKEENIDYEKYAKSISKLFVIDFYSLSNKTSSYDIGGTQYLHKNLKDNFILNASNTIYKYIKTDNKELPTVKEVSVVSTEETEYKYSGKTYFAYKVKLNWKYDYDYDYESEAQFIIIKDNKQLFIVEKVE